MSRRPCDVAHWFLTCGHPIIVVFAGINFRCHRREEKNSAGIAHFKKNANTGKWHSNCSVSIKIAHLPGYEMNWNSVTSVQIIISDLNEIAADAYRHRIRTHVKKGGHGAYDRSNGGFEYSLPKKFSRNSRARFEVAQVSADLISLRAISLENPSCFVAASINERGRLKDISFPESTQIPKPAPPVARIPDAPAVFHSPKAARSPALFFEEQ